ncbi:DUF6894 family protein [Pseudorhizobium sp. NPDC055634]
MRYFFHIRDHGETILDEEGDEFDHPEDAAASAVQAVQELASARIKDGLVIDDQRLDLCDENGVLLLSLSFQDVVRKQLKPQA